MIASASMEANTTGPTLSSSIDRGKDKNENDNKKGE